jgi:hypothetical protein
VGPSVRPGKGKEKGPSSVLGKKGAGPAQGPTRLGSARLHGLARPVAQQASSGPGLAGRVGRLAFRLPSLSLSLPSGPRGQWCVCACVDVVRVRSRE